MYYDFWGLSIFKTDADFTVKETHSKKIALGDIKHLILNKVLLF